jgi:hypothetical protein
MHLGQFDRLIPDFVRRIGHFPVEENVGLARLDFLGWYPSDILIVELVPLTPVQRVRNVVSSACRTVMTDDRKQLVRRHFRNTIGVEIGSHVEPLQRKTDRRRDLAAEHQLVPEPLQVDAEDFRELQDLTELDAVPELVALFAAVHVVPFQLVGAEEGRQAVVQRDHGTVEPRLQPGQDPRDPALVHRDHGLGTRRAGARRATVQHHQVVPRRYRKR